MMKKEIAQKIIYLLRSDPMGWHLDRYNARYGNFEMWITNARYADLRIGDYRIKRRYRRKVRKALAYTKEQQILALLGTPQEKDGRANNNRHNS